MKDPLKIAAEGLELAAESENGSDDDVHKYTMFLHDNFPDLANALIAERAELVLLRAVAEAAEKFSEYVLTEENKDVFLSRSFILQAELKQALSAWRSQTGWESCGK